MTDQYRASLWDIQPSVQVCGVGENDTVILDGARGAQIQWTSFAHVGTTRRQTVLRSLTPIILERTPMLFVIAIPLLMKESTRPYGALLLAISCLAALCSPLLVRYVYSGKLWSTEPCLFGIEGYVPLPTIEAKLFGLPTGGAPRMRWSPFGSPLSRHCAGDAVTERTLFSPLHCSSENCEQTPGSVDTYLVEPLDPTSHCPACAHLPASTRTCAHHETPFSCAQCSRASMGSLKVFTLVDTATLTATLFLAARTPTALVVAGAEGGMQRAIACSLDAATGTFYRETVLRIPSRCVDYMTSLERVRLGLRSPFLPEDVERVPVVGKEEPEEPEGWGDSESMLELGRPAPAWDAASQRPSTRWGTERATEMVEARRWAVVGGGSVDGFRVADCV